MGHFSFVLGVDEVGRGCWAGPLVVAVVALIDDMPGLTDSKLIRPQQRERLAARIRSQALICETGWVWPAEIDQLGLTAATTLAIERAMAKCDTSSIKEIIIDGSVQYLPNDVRSVTMVKADVSVPAVSAASIVAKVSRDAYMTDQSEHYANYGFERHVGYGTAQHSLALKKFGITPLHRLSFKPIKSILNIA